MPWLGQEILAGQFAAAVGLALGQGNYYAGLPFEPVYLWKTDYLAGVAQSPGDWGSNVFNPLHACSQPSAPGGFAGGLAMEPAVAAAVGPTLRLSELRMLTLACDGY
jgi:hypothetical protein